MLAWSIEVELHPLVADSIKSTDDQPDCQKGVFDLAQGGLRQGRLEPNTQPNGAAMTLLRLWARVPRNTGPALFYRLRWRPRSAERCSTLALNFRYGAQAPRSQLGACLASVPAHPKPACWAGRINNQCAT